MDYQLNDIIRNLRLLACLVQSLEVWKFLGENQLGTGPVQGSVFLPCLSTIIYA